MFIFTPLYFWAYLNLHYPYLTYNEKLELTAIAYTETHLNPYLISETGDYGLLQINCYYWHNDRNCWKLMDIDYNIKMAIKIIRNCKRKSKNWLKCYNGSNKYKNIVIKNIYIIVKLIKLEFKKYLTNIIYK